MSLPYRASLGSLKWPRVEFEAARLRAASLAPADAELRFDSSERTVAFAGHHQQLPAAQRDLVAAATEISVTVTVEAQL